MCHLACSKDVTSTCISQAEARPHSSRCETFNSCCLTNCNGLRITRVSCRTPLGDIDVDSTICTCGPRSAGPLRTVGREPTALDLKMTTSDFTVDCLQQAGFLSYSFCNNFQVCCINKCIGHANIQDVCKTLNNQIDESSTSCTCSAGNAAAGNAFSPKPPNVWLIPIVLSFVKNWHRWADNWPWCQQYQLSSLIPVFSKRFGHWICLVPPYMTALWINDQH